VASFVHGGSSMLAVVVCMATFVPYIPKLVDAVPKLMLHFFVWVPIWEAHNSLGTASAFYSNFFMHEQVSMKPISFHFRFNRAQYNLQKDQCSYLNV
jgi:hypothetical protein